MDSMVQINLYIRFPAILFLGLVQAVQACTNGKTLKSDQLKKPGPYFQKDASFGEKKKLQKV